jgi:membrane protein implicated in regulation of membrane protease activity
LNSNANSRRFTIYHLCWLGVYLGIALATLLLLPFPFDFIILFGVMILLINLMKRRRRMQQYRSKGGIKKLFGMSTSGNSNNPLRYYCMS